MAVLAFSASSFPVIFAARGVFTSPGATAFTRMFRGA